MNDPKTALLRSKKNNFFSSSAQNIFAKNSNNSLAEPMTPGITKNKLSFFDVVKKLNPFLKKNQLD